VHFVVDNVTGGAEVDRVDDFVVAVVFVAVEIGGLASVAWVGLVSCILDVVSRLSIHTRVVEE
jgi:hypothetical protein